MGVSFDVMGRAPIAMRTRLIAVLFAAAAIVFGAAWIVRRAPCASPWDYLVAIGIAMILAGCVSVLWLTRQDGLAIASPIERVQEHLFWIRNNVLLLIQAGLA